MSERSVRRRRRAWQKDGRAGLALRGQAERCRLDEAAAALDAGPLGAGRPGQWRTLARVHDLMAGRFGVACTGTGDLYLVIY